MKRAHGDFGIRVFVEDRELQHNSVLVGTQLDPEDVLRADGAGGRRTLGTVSAGDVDIPCADDVRGVFDVGRQRV